MTFGNVSEIWVVAKHGVAVAASTSAAFYTTEHSAMAHAKELATRDISVSVYRCEHVADVVVDGPRVIDHRAVAMPG